VNISQPKQESEKFDNNNNNNNNIFGNYSLPGLKYKFIKFTHFKLGQLVVYTFLSGHTE